MTVPNTYTGDACGRKSLNGKSHGTPLATSTPFVGRDKELREIAFYLGESAAGSSQNILLTGPSGIGKTRLIGQLASIGKLARKWAWIQVEARRGDAEAWPFLLEHLLGGLRLAAAGVKLPKKAGKRKSVKDSGRDANSPSQLRELAASGNLPDIGRLLQDVVDRQIVPSGRKGLVLVVDDAHLLCSHSPAAGNRLQEMLEFVQILQGARHPVNLVLSGLPRLGRALEKCRSYRRESFRRYPLGELSSGDVPRMLRQWAAGFGLKAEFKPYARELHKLAGGNPRMLLMWCGEIFAALRANSQRRPKDLLAAVDEQVRFAHFERHWEMTTSREREVLRIVSGTLGDKGNFALQDLIEQARRSGINLAKSNVHQILIRLEQKDMLYAKSHGKYHLTMPLLDDFVRRMGAGA